MTPGAVKTTSVSAPTPTVMTLSGNEREERRPLGWLHMVDGRFAALLTDRLQNIERYVSEGLEWLQGVRQQQQPPRQKPRQKKKQQQEPEPDQGERSEGDREIVNEICASAGLPTSTSASRGRRRRGRPGKDAASTVDVTGRISGAINPVNDEIPSAIRENQPRREAETGTETETEESQGTNITMTIKATPLRPPPSSLTVPDSVTAPRIIRTGDADATTSMLVTTATVRSRSPSFSTPLCRPC